ncbi:transposase [Lignipirellula cremea]
MTFPIKDGANGGRRGALTLSPEDFLRRFLLHGFNRIRRYGLLANGGPQ